MIWVMLGLLLATMLLGIPILLCIALIGFIGIAAEPGAAVGVTLGIALGFSAVAHAARVEARRPEGRAERVHLDSGR